MATYRQDLTQTVNPATADVASLQEASRMNAEMTKTIGESLKQGINIFEAASERSALNEIRTKAEEEGKTYIQRNEDFKQANELQSIADKIGKENAAGSEDALAGLNTRIAQLKERAAGGIRPEDYVTQVSLEARKYMVKYPHLANKVREIFATETGVPGADAYYIQATVKRDLAGGGQESAKFQQQLLANDLKEMSDTQGKTQLELYQLSVNQPEEFARLRADHNELKRIRQQTQAVQDSIKNAEVYGDREVDNLKPGLAALVQGNVVDSVMTVTSSADQQTKFQNRINYMIQKGDPSSSAELAAEAELWTKQNLAFVQRGKQYAMMTLNDFAARNKISDTKFQEMKRYIDAQAAVEEERWGDKNTITAQSLVMHKYGKEVQAKQALYLDLTLKHIQGFGQDVIRQYMLNKDQLQKTNPDVVRILDEAYGQVEATGKTLNATNNKLGSVALYVQNVGETGEVPAIPATMAREDKRAVHSVVMANATAALDAAQNNTLTKQQVNYLKSGMSIGVLEGANSSQLATEAHKMQPKFAQLDPTTQGVVKDAVSRNTLEAIRAINSIKEGVKNKAGLDTDIAVGVNSAGDLVVLKQQTNIYGGGMAQSQAEDAAMAEFRRKASPLLLNLVNTRFIVDGGKDKLAIAREYADVINGKTQYKPFFTLEAVPTQQPTGGKMATMADIAAFAASKNMSIDQAVEGLKAQGYTVGE
jgi:hypothetical protein